MRSSSEGSEETGDSVASADDGLRMPSVEELSDAAGYRDESLTELTEAAAESVRDAEGACGGGCKRGVG